MANERLISKCPEYPKNESRESLHLLATDISKATERGAIAAARTAGMGKNDLSDEKAVEAMREYLNTLPIQGKIVIGEGERDEAPMLYIGEYVGDRKGPEFDIAVDPLENTNAAAFFGSGSISTLAVAEKGGLFNAPDMYMDKLVVGPWAKGKVSIEKTPEENLKVLAESLDRDITDLVIVVLKRTRNDELIERILNTGARVKKIEDGDLMPGVAACFKGSGVHAQMGIGGAPEGVLTAVAAKCMGGEMQVKLRPDPKKEGADVERLKKMGGSMNKVYTQDDLARGNLLIFSATGVTDSEFLKGVRFFGDGARTNTLTIVKEEKSNLLHIDFTDRIHIFKPGTPVSLT